MSAIEGRFQRKLIATYLILVLAIVAVAGLYILFLPVERASIASRQAWRPKPASWGIRRGSRMQSWVRQPVTQIPSVAS